MITRRTLLVSTAAGVFAPWRLLGRLATPDLVIHHTNDLHGRVDLPEGPQGFAYLAREIRRARAAHPQTLALDAGDIIHGTAMESLRGPGPVIGAMNAAGFHAATVGNHEFDFGPENLRRAERLADFPFLSANVRTSGGDPWGPLKPYVVLRRAGRRIGIFGLTTEQTPDIQWPRTIEGIRFTDAEEAARECVRALREREKVDLVVALSHLGYKPDQKLAHNAPGIDLIIGGHSHTRLDKATVENGVPIVQTGAHGKALGRTEVFFDGPRARFEYRLIDASAIGVKDATVMRSYAPHAKALAGELEDVLTTLPAPLASEGLTKEATPTGRFLAESVRAAHRADVGLFSSSHFGGLGAGEVRRRDVYAAMGAYTRQHVVRAQVPGELLRAELAKVAVPGAMSVQVAGAEKIEPGQRVAVAGPAHVMQAMFLDKPGVRFLYDDPLGPNVRDAVMEGLKRGLYRPFLTSAGKAA